MASKYSRFSKWTSNDIRDELTELLDDYSNLPINRLKRYDGGFSIIMDDDTVFDVTIVEGEPYYY